MTPLWILIGFGIGYMTASAIFLIAHIRDSQNPFIFEERAAIKRSSIDLDAMAAQQQHLDMIAKHNNPLT